MSPRSKELSERMKARSRSAIMKAALELFAKKGFSATTTDAIAKKAKVSKGLIFSHFATKQDILFALIDEQVDQVLPRIEERDEKANPRETLVSLFNAWHTFLKNEPLLARLSLQLNLDDEYRKIIRRKGKEYIELYLGRVRDLFVQLGSDSPDLDCYMLAIFFDGITANYVVAPELFPLDKVKDRFLETLLLRFEKQPVK